MTISGFRCSLSMKLGVVAICCAAAATFMITPPADAQIRWLNGPSEIAHQLAPEQLEQRLTEIAEHNEARRVLVRLNAPITNQDKAFFANAGLNLLQYVGDNAYFAAIDRNVLESEKLAFSNQLASVEPVHHEWKLHPDLADGIIQPWSIVGEHMVARSENGKAEPDERPRFEFEADVAVYVNFHADVDLDIEGANTIRKMGGEVRSLVRSTNMIVVHLPASRIE